MCVRAIPPILSILNTIVWLCPRRETVPVAPPPPPETPIAPAEVVPGGAGVADPNVAGPADNTGAGAGGDAGGGDAPGADAGTGADVGADAGAEEAAAEAGGDAGGGDAGAGADAGGGDGGGDAGADAGGEADGDEGAMDMCAPSSLARRTTSDYMCLLSEDGLVLLL